MGGSIRIRRPEPDARWCEGCINADWESPERVDQFFQVGDGGLVDLSGITLPACSLAMFYGALGRELPSAAIHIQHIGRGPQQGEVVGNSYLGACEEGDECTGRNR